jgi:2-C-methyl-D-erythritol 4-phosphate cytidylyltransferase
MKITAVILASGTGERFLGDKPKQFVKLAGLPVLVHTLKVFESNKQINEVIVVTNEIYIDLVWEYASQYHLSKIQKVVAGGKTRQESSMIGLESCDEKTKYVLIHDGVRPFITNKIIDEIISSVKIHKAVDTVIASSDTIVQVNENNFIENIPNRNYLRRGQTPQAFEYSLILEAHKKAIKNNMDNSTDDCALVLKQNHPVFCINGDEQNIKITYPIDLHIADKLFQLRTQSVQNKMDFKNFFNNKVILVIGGTSGIGKKLVEKLQINGAIVYPLSRNTDIKIDITNISSIKLALNEILEKENKIDFIINCAGDLIRKNIEFMNIDEWEYIYDLNIKSCFLLSKVSIPMFKKQGFGNLIFISSSSYTRGRGGYAAYCSSKAALVNYSQALAEEVLDSNIKVNVVSPGRVATPLRKRNFGKEDPSTLLTAEYVAEKILEVLIQDTTGSVFEII